MSNIIHRFINSTETIDNVEKIKGQLCFRRNDDNIDLYLDISTNERLYVGTVDSKKINYTNNQSVYAAIESLMNKVYNADEIEYFGTIPNATNVQTALEWLKENGGGGSSADLTIIADKYSDEETYEIGDYVIKDSELYKKIQNSDPPVPPTPQTDYSIEDNQIFMTVTKDNQVYEISSTKTYACYLNNASGKKIVILLTKKEDNGTITVNPNNRSFLFNFFNTNDYVSLSDDSNYNYLLIYETDNISIDTQNILYHPDNPDPSLIDKISISFLNNYIKPFTEYLDSVPSEITAYSGEENSGWIEEDWDKTKVMNEIKSGGGAGLSNALTSISDGTHTIQASGSTGVKIVGSGNVEVNVNPTDKTVTITGNGGGDPYELPIASKTELGGVKIGNNLTIDEDGTLNATGGGGDPYVLPEASETTLGGIKVGSRLSIQDGILSADDQSTTIVDEVVKGNAAAVSSNAVATALEGITTPAAAAVSYDNSTTSIEATNVQAALDEIVDTIGKIDLALSNILYGSDRIE